MKTRFLLLVLIAGVVGAGLRANLGALPLQTPDLLYVCIQDDAKIAVVDMPTKAVLRLIDVTTLGFPATAKPHYVVVEPDGSSWYVSLIGANRVVKFDRANNVLAQFEMETPGMMALDPTSDLMLVGGRTPPRHDLERLRRRIGEEPFRTALKVAWRTDSLEGLLARFVAGPELSRRLAASLPELNTDDRNALEFGFARTLGVEGLLDVAAVREAGAEAGASLPVVSGDYDAARVHDDTMTSMPFSRPSAPR